MKIYVSRGSVAAGDDINAPNSESLSVPDGTGLREIVQDIAQSSYLPQIAGGQATWSVTSNIPVAIVAQQWAEPRMLNTLKLDRPDELDRSDGVLRLYFNYHAQIDPETVYKVFWGFQLSAI
ncbi:MAG: hypothetical protein LBK55_06920 [Azoarcus sp.]|jgi:hypothetical protein|nr:hypothetical protein [Azoarcus sp.]